MVGWGLATKITPKGKKFLTKKFRELIHEISIDSMSNQKQRLNEEFVKWKNKEDQTDDILVIGLELLLVEKYSVFDVQKQNKPLPYSAIAEWLPSGFPIFLSSSNKK